jgi:hypothetical protein
MFESQTPTQVALFGAFTTVSALLVIMQFFFLWRNRNHKIVQIRSIPSVVLTALGVVCILFTCLLFPVINAPCFYVSFSGVLGTAMCVAFSFERCILIVGQFKIVMEAKELAREMHGDNLEVSETSDKSWFLRNRRFFHSGLISWTKFGAAIFTLVLAIPTLLFLYTAHPADWVFAPFYSEQCQLLMIDSFKGVAISCTFASIFIGLIAKHLLAVQENFYFKQEMFYQTMVGSCIGGYYFMYAFIPNFSDLIRMPITITFLLIGGVLSMISFSILVGYVSLKVYQEEHFSFKRSTKLLAVEIEEARNFYQKMTIILKNEKALQLFEAFLCKEFAVENLLFWKAVESLKQRLGSGLLNGTEALDEAKRIHNTFCATSAQLNVNISSEQRSLLITLLDESSQGSEQEAKQCLDGLEKAQQEIFTLMSNDSLRRFLRSEEYQNFMVQNGQPSSPSGKWKKSITQKHSSKHSRSNLGDSTPTHHSTIETQASPITSPRSRTSSAV